MGCLIRWRWLRSVQRRKVHYACMGHKSLNEKLMPETDKNEKSAHSGIDTGPRHLQVRVCGLWQGGL